MLSVQYLIVLWGFFLSLPIPGAATMSTQGNLTEENTYLWKLPQKLAVVPQVLRITYRDAIVRRYALLLSFQLRGADELCPEARPRELRTAAADLDGVLAAPCTEALGECLPERDLARLVRL